VQVLLCRRLRLRPHRSLQFRHGPAFAQTWLLGIRDGVAREEPETWVSLATNVAVVTASMEAIATHFLCPDPFKITAGMLMYQADPQLYVIKEMRKWAQACVRSLYGALSVANAAYRLDECHQRLFASFLVEDNFNSEDLLFNCLDPRLSRNNILDNECMRSLKIPPWSTAIVPGPTMLDPYLGLRRLRGPVSYMYLEPKPEWRARLPHLPAVILLGDRHEAKPPCPGFDLHDDKTKEVGGTQSFWHFLDTDPTLSAFTKDVVLEHWMPKHERLSMDLTPLDLSIYMQGPLKETYACLHDCVGQVRTPACTLPNLRVHVADLRERYLESDFNEEHLRDRLFGAVVVRRLLSLNILRDLDDEHLRRERLAHEFNQLHESVQAELRLKLAAIPQQQYPYDLAQAVMEWMKFGESGQYYPPPIHPVVEKDMRDIAEEQNTTLDRRVMSLELYALSRMLKDAHTSKPRLAVLYAGRVHCRNASYLLHGMYNVHGAAACSDNSGCIDFATPTDTCYSDFSLDGKYVDFDALEPQRPITWDSDY
jgi:hypothetical protein